MTNYQRQLRRELRSTGASDAEIRPLLSIAAGLTELRPGNTIAKSSRSTRTGWRRVLRPAVYTLLGAAMGVVVLASAQAVLPTSWLFPVQRTSDNIAMHIHPEYRATVMMKRARQVNQLVVNHATTPQILATLADYTTVANAYKTMPHTNYAAFEYCESKLERAEAGAPPAVQRAIAGSLYSLETS